MKSIIGRLGLGLLSCVCAASARAAESAAHAPAEIPAAAFFSLEDMDEPVLSPSGDWLAILVRNKEGRRQLAVLDTHDLNNAKVVGGFTDADVTHVRWLNDQRLMYETGDQQSAAYDSRGWAQMAVDRDGRHPVRVADYGVMFGFGQQWVREGMGQLVRTLRDGSADVISADWTATNRIGYGNVLVDSTPRRYDTNKGADAPVFEGRVPHDIQQWIFDEAGKLRGGLSVTPSETVLFAQDGQGAWVERARFPVRADRARPFSIVRLATDGRLYVRRSPGGPGAGAGLYRLDLDTGRIEADAIATAPGYDIDPTLIEDRRQHKVIGVRYVTDAEGTVWFDPAMKAMQARIDEKLPGRINRVEPAECGCAQRVLVTSFSDRQPALFYLYERDSGSLVQIGDSRPSIDPRQAADTDFVRIKARDGQTLPVYVTKPHGKGPWPTVVLVHGGPWVRGWSWQWDGESQFLASRGYLVVKPEFRGSDGYGDELRESGHRQWGLKMQDDIADATRWAAAQGLADPARTCIAGASYGGYAVLMGLVRYPDLYRCGVAASAISDLKLVHDVYWSDMSDDYRENDLPVLVGDPDKDAEQLVATSPLQQAARITRPLLLAHGGVDRRVPIVHATKLRSALEAHHAPVTWIEYKDEAHGWSKPGNRIDFYERMEAFLAANLAPAAK